MTLQRMKVKSFLLQPLLLSTLHLGPFFDATCPMLQESLLQQENTLSRGYNELLGSLGQRASAQPVAPQALKEKRSWDSPEILGKLDAM